MSEKPYAPPSQPPPHEGDSRPLPDGWMRQFDSNSNAWFYVDTRASPPRSIWLHPLDDAKFLEEHPHFRDYGHPPNYEGSPSPPPVPTSSRPRLDAEKKKPEKRSFIGKLKDKAIGTKEERAAAKEQARRAREEEKRQRLEWQRAHAAQYGAPPQFGGYQQQYAGPSQGYGQPVYGQPMQQGYGQPAYQQPRRGGGMGMGVPLLGGLAGGLLLGEMLGGDGGGDFGGGDFGGGDF
ncbi:hypothetical protein BU17DRAFT_84102 [Hysterangium stoloniferum]|nr:hypothetical protein BU17DRAFT_84102 [Hysterangium stoloniferum]